MNYGMWCLPAVCASVPRRPDETQTSSRQTACVARRVFMELAQLNRPVSPASAHTPFGGQQKKGKKIHIWTNRQRNKSTKKKRKIWSLWNQFRAERKKRLGEINDFLTTSLEENS